MFERSKLTEPQSAEKRLTTDESLVYEMWPIGRPKPNPHNARVHSPDQISQLAASMREFGCTRPLLADETDTLLAGHGACHRLQSQQRLRIGPGGRVQLEALKQYPALQLSV